MILRLQQLFENPGQKLDFSDTFHPAWGQMPLMRLVSPVAVSGQIENKAGVVTATYQLKVQLSAPCDRCLAEVSIPFDEHFEHTLVTELEDEALDADELILVAGGELDLSQLAEADLSLNLPTTVLCRPDCKGLCPKCGCDRNQHTCTCPDHEPDPRFAALRALKLDEE